MLSFQSNQYKIINEIFIFFLSYESFKIQICFTLLAQLNLNAFYVLRKLTGQQRSGVFKSSV